MQQEGADYYRFDTWNILPIMALPFYPHGVERTRRTAPIRYSEESSRNLLFVFLLSGTLHYRCDRVDFYPQPGELLVIPRGNPYAFESFTTGAYDKIVLEIRGSGVIELQHSLFLAEPVVLTVPELDLLLDKIGRLREKLKRKEPSDIPSLAGSTYEIMTLVSMNLPKRRSRATGVVPAVMARLDSDFDKQINLAALAEHHGISQRTLQRRFKQENDISIQCYRFRKRMEHAACLLRHSSLSIKEISQKTGYCNQFHFSAEFRKYAGTNPKEFRRKAPPA
ncbi:MAG: helix-turn-helix transcriptional regulator [Lentisphaeria bacterium]|nr:helix-turn-helix transcriptional regulator [Lentisphaeria bacterium]